MALVIIMLSALEEQVSGYYSYFFFGVFTYLKNDQKELTAKLSSRYCSVRITKANAITRRIGGGRGRNVSGVFATSWRGPAGPHVWFWGP